MVNRAAKPALSFLSSSRSVTFGLRVVGVSWRLTGCRREGELPTGVHEVGGEQCLFTCKCVQSCGCECIARVQFMAFDLQCVREFGANIARKVNRSHPHV